jgi:alginate O-acetyltransferase complex protein AlgJ
MIQAAQLTARMKAGSGSMPNNQGYSSFAASLRAQGVDVLDVWPDRFNPAANSYLVQDTHWTPEFMEETARTLALSIGRSSDLPPVAAPDWALNAVTVSRVGDLVDMLKLPPGQSLFAPREVTIHRVVDRQTERPWQADPNADILLLGDSFTNIYSHASMGWGDAAGFAEHLSYSLRRPIDVIAQNGGGASGTRAELARPDNVGRLLSKKILIYEFAIRNLLAQNWERIPLAAALRASQARASEAVPVPPSSTSTPQTPGSPLIVVGEIVRISRVPQPGSAPYTDCLTFAQIKVTAVEAGHYADPILLVALWGMRNDKWLPAARYGPGDRLRLNLVPLKDADTRVRTVQRSDDTDDFDHLPYFATEEKLLR